MDKVIITVVASLFFLIMIGSLVFFIYKLINNTPYPETESLMEIMEIPTSESDNLTQLTIQDMQDTSTKLPKGYSLPPSTTKFQCLLPSLRQ